MQDSSPWSEDIPSFDWKDEGRVVEVENSGVITRGTLELIDAYFNGEDEYPMFWFEEFPNWTGPDLYGCDRWRFAEI